MNRRKLKIITTIRSLADPERALISQRFFKTGKGDYGEGDVFLGLTMPQLREVVKKHVAGTPFLKGRSDKFTPSNEEGNPCGGEKNIEEKKGDLGKNKSSTPRQARGTSFKKEVTLEDIDELLHDKHHEIRMAGVLALVYFTQKKIYPIDELARYYLEYSGFHEIPPTPLYQGGKCCINNWDLIDVSSEHIIGPYIQHHLSHEERVDFITKCIASSNIWINRIIILASFHQIKQGNGKLTIYIAERTLSHKHDLIHKAVGWMLREVGKRCSMDELRGFLNQYATQMPRTMLRYAIEKMGEEERKKYLLDTGF